MALIRGVNSNFPCPVCLIPGDQLTDLSTNYTLRTTESMKKIYDDAQNLNATQRENLLKAHGLRDVSVCEFQHTTLSTQLILLY